MQQTFSTPKYWSISTSLSNISPACLSTPRGDWQQNGIRVSDVGDRRVSKQPRERALEGPRIPLRKHTAAGVRRRCFLRKSCVRRKSYGGTEFNLSRSRRAPAVFPDEAKISLEQKGAGAGGGAGGAAPAGGGRPARGD